MISEKDMDTLKGNKLEDSVAIRAL